MTTAKPALIQFLAAVRARWHKAFLAIKFVQANIPKTDAGILFLANEFIAERRW
jgi:hypothetical protein